jgi:hypothetical protein
MKRAAALAAFLLAGLGAAPRALADAVPLLGLFEGHGIAPPARPERARAAVAAAQRVHNLCTYLYQARGGGTATETHACAPRKKALATLGRDAAAAILDVLDEPRAQGMRGDDSFPALIRALAATGREDVVPVMITAMERLSARGALPDAQLAELHWNQLSAFNEALTELTYFEAYEQPFSTNSSNDKLPPVLEGWKAWWAANKTKTRAAWKAESLARVRRRLAVARGDAGHDAALVLYKHAETRGEGIAALKRLARDPSCKDGCWSVRYTLAGIEPRAGWLPRP